MYIVVVSFITARNLTTRRKLLIHVYRKLLTNVIT